MRVWGRALLPVHVEQSSTHSPRRYHPSRPMNCTVASVRTAIALSHSAGGVVYDFRGCGKTHLYFVRDEIEGGMRATQDEQEEVFSYIPLEKRVPQDHPLRRGREMTDRALQELSGWFDSLYAQPGRPPLPPGRLLRAQILQALYTIRSERQLMDQID